MECGDLIDVQLISMDKKFRAILKQNFPNLHMQFELVHALLNKLVEIVLHPNRQMNYRKPCLIRALTKPTINETTRSKNKEQNKQKQNIFTAKIKYLNLKAHSNIVKLQSDEPLTKKTYFSLNYKAAMRQGKKLTKRRNSEAKFKNKSILFKPNYQSVSKPVKKIKNSN